MGSGHSGPCQMGCQCDLAIDQPHRDIRSWLREDCGPKASGPSYPLCENTHCWHPSTVQHASYCRDEICCHCGASSCAQMEGKVPDGHGEFCTSKEWRVISRRITPRWK